MKLHGDRVAVAEFREFAIDVGVVDFAGAGLMAAGNVGDVDQPDHVDMLVEFLDEIAFGDLFVEKIVQELDLRVVDGADDVDGFLG